MFRANRLRVMHSVVSLRNVPTERPAVLAAATTRHPENPLQTAVVNPFTARKVSGDGAFSQTMRCLGFATKPASGHWFLADRSKLCEALTGDPSKQTQAARAVVTKLRASASSPVAASPGDMTGPPISVRESLNGRRKPLEPLADDPATVDPVIAQIDSFLQDSQRAVGSVSDIRPPMPPRLAGQVVLTHTEDDMTEDQRRVLELVNRGLSVFIGGRAGTGKTALLRIIYQDLATRRGLRVGLTALTGVAGVHVGGTTFHSGLSVPMRPGVKWDPKVFRSIDVLIVDEVSLLSASLLEAFDEHARVARKSNRPFGGIQLILCGDFLQLVPDSGDVKSCLHSSLLQHVARVELVTPLRHKSDSDTYAILAALRIGRLPDELLPRIFEPDAIPAHLEENSVRIFPRRKDALERNNLMLSKIDAEEHSFAPTVGNVFLTGSMTDVLVMTMPFGTPVKAVELHRLLHRGLCDGLTDGFIDSACISVGVREGDGFSTLPGFTAFVRTEDAPGSNVSTTLWRRVATAAAEACKADTFDFHAFGSPAAGVAAAPPLAIAAQLTEAAETTAAATVGLKLGCRVMVNRNLSAQVVNGSCGTVIDFAPPNPDLFPDRFVSRHTFSQIPAKARPALLPVVQLTNGVSIQIPPLPTLIGGGANTNFFAVTQYTIPLQLGYAFTVHKVQGLTLEDDVVVDCTNMFKCAHLVYVSCSRVRSASQLHIIGLKPGHIIVNRDCHEFVASLQRADHLIDVQDTVVPADWWVTADATEVAADEDNETLESDE